MTKSNAKILLQVKLRDLQSLLRKKLGEDLQVISYVADSLLPPGENYGSSILKVHAIVKKTSDGKEEDLHLVAKMVPPTEIQRMVFDSPHTFKKEAFLYRELIPSYQRLELEFGISKADIFDIAPEYFGARYSLKSDEEFDDDAVILMQNLKVLDYYTGDRKQGLDLEHSKSAVTAVARFHALGIAMRQHKPHDFETLKVQVELCHESRSLKFEDRQEFYLQQMRDDPEISTHYERLKAVMSEKYEFFVPRPPESWSTIIHADFWVNNIMYRKDSTTDRITDIKFVDFQNYHYSSPQRELIFFLMTSLNVEVMASHFEEIIDTYYNAFIEVLVRMKIDTGVFGREEFDERMKIDAPYELSHWPIILKVMSADVANETSLDQIEGIFLDGTVSALFRERLRRCVKKYAEKGWLGEN